MRQQMNLCFLDLHSEVEMTVVTFEIESVV